MTQLPADEISLLESIGAHRGCLKKGGIVDFQKTGLILIQDLRSGKLGKISFETIEDIENDCSTS